MMSASQVVRAVKVLVQEKAIAPELSKQFEDAQAWLQNFRI